ncbi:Transposase [Phaeobacter sp. CECT 5382]|nr:Transposase [Phaeobacter sp. CECT 5382]
MNTKLHAICDSQGRPLNLFVTAGQVSDYIGAGALVSSLPTVEWLLGDRGYDADWFREALKDKGIRACIPGRKQRKKTVNYDKRRYKRRNRIEIMFGRLKDWRRVATRYDRCPKVFLSAIALAALVIYWLCVLTLVKKAKRLTLGGREAPSPFLQANLWFDGRVGRWPVYDRPWLNQAGPSYNNLGLLPLPSFSLPPLAA